MSRRIVALGVVGALLLVVAGDLWAGGTLNPYQAPPLMALGSGQAAGGAHCAALPGS